MARCGDGASRPHTCGTVSRLVHRGGAYGGAGRDGHGSRAGLAVTPGGVGGPWWSRGQHNVSYVATQDCVPQDWLHYLPTNYNGSPSPLKQYMVISISIW